MNQPVVFTPYPGKRCLDIVGAVILLLVSAPIFLALTAAILVAHGKSVLFWQRRVGLNGKLFAFPKFRSMVTDAEARKALLRDQNMHGVDDVTFKMSRDPRTTRTGRFIRRHSLDELPQLWCVLKGDMSLVGPRPPVPEEVARYTPEQQRRLEVKPGLTGLWQVSGRSELSFRQQVALDLDYAEKQSLPLDLKILARTVPAVLTGRGAY
ncbi:MAG: sugar transferase [Lentisphaeria bacterium]|nr:sugar transferase [Lentisphaeria bacterium]